MKESGSNLLRGYSTGLRQWLASFSSRAPAQTSHVAVLLMVVALIALALIPRLAAQQNSSIRILNGDPRPNTASQIGKHYVVLVSIDGFRYDYAKKYKATHLLALANRGATAPDGMMPSYPSVTFPNHYAIVSGLYPEHSGIVANSFYDPSRRQVFRYTDPATGNDGSWYSGTPLWVLAIQQGMRSACFFWPASEANIEGIRPTFYLKYDEKVPNDARVKQVLAWLALPPSQRPHFITLYFSNVDSAGHEHGPDSPEVAAAVHEDDSEIGALEAGIEKTKLPVDLIVVSDHGMAKTEGGWNDLAPYLSNVHLTQTVGSLLYAASDADAQTAYNDLNGKSTEFQVYRRAQVPAYLNYNASAREGDPVIVATGPYAFRFAAPSGRPDTPPEAGTHGYDPTVVPEMKASFFAAGPDILGTSYVTPFDNVDIYALVAQLLGLVTPPVDGSLQPLRSIIKGVH